MEETSGFCRFFYPTSPSNEDLPYKAHCTNPGVEHAIRNFLDWVEVELGNCVKLQKYCGKIWQQDFPFPRAILRNEIESDGYVSGDFCITMNQTKILELLTGENLYDNQDVFVRELLQNAIDATLLREKMDPDFIPERSRIDFWEWNDKDGNIWFRIDDEGTGMTQGMLERYFLKVGNSYYTSREIERDMRDHNQMKSTLASVALESVFCRVSLTETTQRCRPFILILIKTAGKRGQQNPILKNIMDFGYR